MPTYPQASFTAPDGATRITLVRHGQSEAADPEVPFPLKDGHGDPALTELGERQAIAVADRLEHEPIDAIYVSSLVRTHQTAAPLAARLDITPIVEPDLREVFLGDWEGGLFRHMLVQEHEAALEFRRTYEWGNVPGAETNAELTARTTAAIGSIHRSHPGEHVACFVHGGVIAALCARATAGQMYGFVGSDNAAMHRLVITEDRWFLRQFNDGGHLGDLLTPAAAVEQPA